MRTVDETPGRTCECLYIYNIYISVGAYLQPVIRTFNIETRTCYRGCCHLLFRGLCAVRRGKDDGQDDEEAKKAEGEAAWFPPDIIELLKAYRQV